VSIPVSPDRSVKYSLDVILPLSHLNDLLQRQQLPEDWAATFVDTSNVIVAHSRNSARVGRNALLDTPAIKPSQGLSKTRRPDGTPIYVGFGRSGVSGFTVAISVPVAQFARQPNGILLFGGIGVFLIMISTPQKQRARPSAVCVGSLQPASHMAYFHAVDARWRRYSRKSASVRFARKTDQALSNAVRAASNEAAVPWLPSPGFG
jgi:hypothetical protein